MAEKVYLELTLQIALLGGLRSYSQSINNIILLVKNLSFTICRNYDNRKVGKAFQLKLVERMPRVCKAVKANGRYFEEYQI